MMVSRNSAIYVTKNEKVHDQIAINADHSDVVKFRHSSDPDYLIVETRIKKLAEKAPEVVERRFKARGTSMLL